VWPQSPRATLHAEVPTIDRADREAPDREEHTKNEYRRAIQLAGAAVEELQALIQFGDRFGDPLPATVRVAQRSIARWCRQLQLRLDSGQVSAPDPEQPSTPPGP
jgi:hypothetical protein